MDKDIRILRSRYYVGLGDLTSGDERTVSNSMADDLVAGCFAEYTKPRKSEKKNQPEEEQI